MSTLQGPSRMTNQPDYNLRPYAEAVLAATIWGLEYSQQTRGIMDFWDDLDPPRKTLVFETLDRVSALRRAPRKATP